MARLPIPGSDENNWGTVLNDYLLESHSSDGSLKNTAVTTSSIQDSAVTEAKLDSAVQTKLNNPSIPNGTLTPVKLASDAPASGEVLSYNAGSFEWIAGGNGEVNTGNNIGTGGVGVFKQKTGLGLEFKRIDAASNKVSVTDNIANDKIDLNVNEANFTGIPQSAVTSLSSTLASKTDTSRQIATTNSLAGGGDLTADRTLSLVGDVPTPGNSRYYGTDGTGTKGFHVMPSQDPTMGGDLSGTASNAQLASGSVGVTELASSAVTDVKVAAAAAIAQSKIANLVTDLAGKSDVGHTHPAGPEGLATSNSGSTYTVDMSTATVQNITLTANCTFSFTGASPGVACSFTLILNQDATGGRLVTWPAGAKWSGGAAPTLPTSPSKISILSFMSVDNGTTWFGFMSGEDMS